MAADGVQSLLDRRLVIVTGKGGTGKSTVVAALGRAATLAGRRVLLVEMGRDAHLPRLVASEGGAPGPNTPACLRIDPFDALGEYLGLQLSVRTIVDRVLATRAFRDLLNAAPGWRELITLGKIWHLAQQHDRAGRPLYEWILVDAPATGHGLTFLDVPHVVVSAVRAGPLRRNAAMVEDMIRDPDHTVLLPVALAEELPVRETLELLARLSGETGIGVDRVVVNAMLPFPFPDALADLDTRLGRLPAETPLPGLPDAPTLAACAGHLRARAELNARWAETLERESGLPCIHLPYRPEGINRAGDLDPLAAPLLPDIGRPERAT